MEDCGAEEDHIVIFDRSKSRGWDEKVFYHKMKSNAGKEIDVLAM